MGQQNRTEQFRSICKEILSQSGNCKESQDDLAAAKTIPEMVMVWRKYWHGILTEVPLQTIAKLDHVYSEFKEEINAAGVFYNESRNDGFIIVGNCDNVVKIEDKAHAYVLGKAEVWAFGHSYIYANNPDATILLYDHSCGNIQNSTVHACDWSSLISNKAKAHCVDAVTVDLMGGTLTDNGHLLINAYNGSVVYSNLTKNIVLNGSSKIVKKASE